MAVPHRTLTVTLRDPDYHQKSNAFFRGHALPFQPNFVKIGRVALRHTANKQTNGD